MIIVGSTSCNNKEALPWGTPGVYSYIESAKGDNRGASSGINVQTDAEAVAVWIADTGSSSKNTAQAYRREAERLLLWASFEKGKSLSQLFREDFLEFAIFLSRVPPEWIMTTRHRRNSPDWRPFLGQPSISSQKQTMTILKSLISYLVDVSWLIHNPMPASKSKSHKKPTPTLLSLIHI